MASERDMSHPRREPHPLPTYPLAGPGTPRPSRPSRPPKPPLTKQMRQGHWIAVDCVVAAVVALCDVLVLAHPHGPPGATATVPAVMAPLLAACVFVPIALRRRAPVTAFGALIILAVVLADGAIASSALIFLAAAYVLYMVTVTSSRQTGTAALLLALAVMVLIVAVEHRIGADGGGGVFVPVGLALIIAWMTGYSVRQRRLYAQNLQQQAASSAVAEERLRIARELHDVVAHSMSVIAVQAGYGQYVIDTSPGDARDALGAIQATSRDALDEMRRMLGVLRQQDGAPGAAAGPGVPPGAVSGPGAVPGPAGGPAGAGPDGAGPDGADGAGGAGGQAGAVEPAPLSPAPGLGNLGRLIERTRGAGVQVTLTCSGQVRAVPAGIDLSAYRIIQEALTNVVKHAGGGARCVVTLGYGADALDIRVTDDGGSLVLSPAGLRPAGLHAAGLNAVGLPAVGTGHGIIGMRERAHLCGGAFGAGALPGGGFEVTAMLPLIGAAGAAEDGGVA